MRLTITLLTLRGGVAILGSATGAAALLTNASTEPVYPNSRGNKAAANLRPSVVFIHVNICCENGCLEQNGQDIDIKLCRSHLPVSISPYLGLTSFPFATLSVVTLSVLYLII